MNEDEKLNAVVKAALEDGASVGGLRLATIAGAAEREARRRRTMRLMWRCVPAALLAASLALVVAIGTAIRSNHGIEVVEAIGLLRELDGEPLAEELEMTPGEALLAWQESPCAEVVEEML